MLGCLTAAVALGLAGAVASAQTPPPPASAPPEPRFTFSGLVFGDYYYFSQDHDEAWQGQEGFWLRRIFFTFDYTFSPKISTRLRLEMNSSGKLAGTTITPYVKDAWLRWSFSRRQQLTLGLQPSISMDYIESVWELRHIEKTPLDLYKVDHTRDTGISVEGPLNSAQTISYRAQFGNDSGSNSETDRYKDLKLSMRYAAPTGFTVEGVYAYFAHEAHANRTLLQAFVAYRAKQARAGLQYAFQQRHAPDGTADSDLRLDIYSGFAVANLKPGKFSVFARIDRYNDPCPDCASIDYLPIDTSAPFTMVLAGVEYYLHPSVRFSPNVEWVAYSAPEAAGVAAPKDDVVWRATFYWAW